MVDIPTSAAAKRAFNTWVTYGWTPIQAAAMVGNDWQESLMIPAIIGDKGLANNAHGIAQWRGTRFEALKKFAASGGIDWTDLDLQIRFQERELRNEESRAGDRLKAATTLEDACAAAIGYHRPKGYTVKNPKAGHGWNNRLKNTHAAYDAFAAPDAKPAAAVAKPPAVSPPSSVAVATVAPRLQDMVPPYLANGSHGDAVLLLKQDLIAAGYTSLTGSNDYFGGATDIAVTDYQKRRGLEADGVVGVLTAKALDAKMPPLPTLVKPQAVGDAPWFIYGKTLINIRETPGAGDTLAILAWAKAEGGAIAKNYKHDSTAWCALYWNHCLTKAGYKGTETLWALDADGKGWPNVILTGPAVGATFVMRRAGGGHIGFVAGRDTAGNLMILGGNQNDEVSIRPFPPSKALAFRWPLGAALPKATGFNTLPVINSAGNAVVKVT